MRDMGDTQIAIAEVTSTKHKVSVQNRFLVDLLAAVQGKPELCKHTLAKKAPQHCPGLRRHMRTVVAVLPVLSCNKPGDDDVTHCDSHLRCHVLCQVAQLTAPRLAR